MPVKESEYQQLLDHWDVGDIKSIVTPPTGTINTIRILTTDRGIYVLRVYRHQSSERIEREHRVVSWLHEQGIPAVVPLRTIEGNMLVVHSGFFVTLLPYISDAQFRRDELQGSQIIEMGRFLGRLHNALEKCPFTDIPPVKFDIDRSATLSGINRIEGIIRSIDKPQPTDVYALKRLTTRRDWVESRSCEDTSHLWSLPLQVVHGDYQETNVFFKEDSISAVIDWDKVYMAPNVWEVIRTIHLMLEFDTERSIIFVKAYNRERPISINELDIASHCYGLMRAYDLWLFEGIYDDRNERLRQFIRPGGFVPIENKWSRLSPKLRDIQKV